jgi:hypothetical protein
MTIPLKDMLLKFVNELPGVQNNFMLMNTAGILNSPLVNTPGSPDFLVDYEDE